MRICHLPPWGRNSRRWMRRWGLDLPEEEGREKGGLVGRRAVEGAAAGEAGEEEEDPGGPTPLAGHPGGGSSLGEGRWGDRGCGRSTGRRPCRQSWFSGSVVG